MTRKYDVLSIGRGSIDLYANEIGVPFPEVKSFAAYVGGCPTNVSVATKRLGLQSALLTAVGDDLVGDFVLNFLNKEGIDTGFSKRKPGRRTSAFLLAIEPPDNFSIVPYRDNCADLELTVDDVRAAPVSETNILFVTGSGLSRQPSRDATFFAAQQAKAHDTKVILDMDFRPELWADQREFGEVISKFLPLVNVILGTFDEFEKAKQAVATHKHDVQYAESIFTVVPEAVVMKRGAKSTLIFSGASETREVPTFEVPVVNVLGAGDAFAGGFLYGYLKGWDLYRAVRMGNACGAIVVTRHGCANFMPFAEEVFRFIDERGGF
jgi:5-dehydro-2-deoxygluconokinase